MIDEIKLKKIREKKMKEKSEKSESENFNEIKKLEMELANKETQRLQMQERLSDALKRIEELENKPKPKSRSKK